MSLALIRPISATAWELRAAWARGLRISVTLDGRCRMARLEGHVSAVAATDASDHIAGWHVPLDAILAVHRPSRLGDSTHHGAGHWHGHAYKAPQREELPLDAHREFLN